MFSTVLERCHFTHKETEAGKSNHCAWLNVDHEWQTLEECRLPWTTLWLQASCVCWLCHILRWPCPFVCGSLKGLSLSPTSPLDFHECPLCTWASLDPENSQQTSTAFLSGGLYSRHSLEKIPPLPPGMLANTVMETNTKQFPWRGTEKLLYGSRPGSYVLS